MPILNQDFLTQTSHEYKLSPEQKEIFLIKLQEPKKYDEIAEQLGISKVACLKRMSEVYKKFGIEGETRGKENRLRKLLNQKFQNYVLMKTDKVDEQKQEVVNLRSTQQESFSEQALNNPSEWFEELRQKLLCGQGMYNTQQVMREFSSLLPNVIERVAAISKSTELDISLELLEKIEFVLKNCYANSRSKTEFSDEESKSYI